MISLIYMKISEVNAKAIKDSRGDDTIEISITTDVGKFSSSAPNGKSRGKFEAKPYKKSLEGDIDTLKNFSDYFSEDSLEKFEDLRRVEDIVEGNIGANSLFALESACLKAMAKEKGIEVWQFINSKAKLFPRLVGNCIGGGAHSESRRSASPETRAARHTPKSLNSGANTGGKKPDFQEFVLIPDSKSVLKSQNTNKSAKANAEIILKNIDENFSKKRNDESAWLTSLDDKKALEVLMDLRVNANDELKIKMEGGLDIAASSFFKRKKYHYQNPKLDRITEEQMFYLSNLIKNFGLFYIEDPFEENDFESFSKLLKAFSKSLIVGDDLTVTNYVRLEEAIKKKSINGIIVKPNQTGSLLEVKRVCELAKKNNIKIIFSHRSGETDETILADLAFGFGADFFKCGIEGDIREKKIDRLIEIERV